MCIQDIADLTARIFFRYEVPEEIDIILGAGTEVGAY
jgi:hypothetical protein